MLSSTAAAAIKTKTKTKDPLQECHTVLHSLAYLPRAAQHRLHPYQLILCLGSADRSVDSTLVADLSLRLLHVDASRAEEVADTVMALFLGLLRRTYLLSRHAFFAAGWLGSVQPLCRGMRRCRGLVLGIIGRFASASLQGLVCEEHEEQEGEHEY
nr:c-terminal binding protein an [Quercus suber]